ncbi:protein Hir2p [[Candida] railenensis]|uniref:Protein HIR n=1 Tax=[Candida] railenensis TaxID=45579 RepID=A0A9P0QMW7_9ASCO|nr:protein Hir2p [[Candida] railenensis]
MKVLVIPQVFHEGAIHSVDINKDGKILTSGKNSSILEWSPEFFKSDLTSPEAKETVTSIKPQFTHKYHKAPVTVVRWSPHDVNLFASGDSNGEVYIKTGPSSSTPKRVNGTSTAGVVDLTWSSDGRLLCWSTDDHKLHLYDTKSETNQDFTSLSSSSSSSSGSSSAANAASASATTTTSNPATSISTAPDKKGKQLPSIQRSIAFDPTGHYLITLGDDSLIYLYQYEYDSDDLYKFKQIQKISKLVNNMAFNSNYKRITWSPDGEYVCIPTASKNSTSLVSLLSRSKNWTNIISLVGHDVNCQVAKFNPKFYKPNEKVSSHPYNIIATSGSDKTLVIWNTSNESPISILRDLSTEPITDLCWNSDGDTLLAVSLDGHITVVNFEQEELGSTVSSEIVQEIEEAGRKSIKPFDHKNESETTSNNRRGGQSNIQEILDQKNAKSIHEEKAVSAENGVEEKVADEAPVKSKVPVNTDSKSKLKGKIVPEIIPLPNLDDQNQSNAPTADDILQTAMGRKKSSETSNQETGTSATLVKTIPKKEPVSIPNIKSSSQKITTKNGKKRIQPMLISSNGGSSSSTNGLISTKASEAISSGESFSNGSAISSNVSHMEFDKASYSVTEEIFKQSKRGKQPETANGTVNGKKAKRPLEPVKFLSTTIVNPNTTYAKVRLSIPKVRLSFQLESKFESENFVLDIKNGSGNEAKPSRITYYKKDTEIWSDFVPRFVQLATEGNGFLAMCSMDGQILIYSRISGRRILPPLVIGSPLSFLESRGDFLMAVSSIGELYVWNISQKKIHLHAPSSLSPVLELSSKYREDGLSKSDNITMCAITSSGVPLLTISNGTGYLFNKDLNTWQTITESWWAFGSHYWDSVGDEDISRRLQSSNIVGDSSSSSSSIVGLLEQKTNEEILRKTRIGRGKYFNKISKNMIMKEGFENLENSISLSHLENRILCCELLGEKDDFKRFFIAYAKRICELSLKPKLYEICNQLLGPPLEYKESLANGLMTPDKEYEDWSPTICEIEKHDLLKEIITNCAKHRDSQRILTHFARELNLVKGEIEDDVDMEL